MILLKKIKRKIKQLLFTKHPVEAYNILASDYDNQEGNLLKKLDERLLKELLESSDLRAKTLLDVGCGTGRYWKMFLNLGAKKIIGADSSGKMLEILLTKFPGSEVYVNSGSQIPQIKNSSVDLIVSNLTIGYIKNIDATLREWERILKPGGEIMITEYHPEMLQRGGGRTFNLNNKTISVRNFIHPLEKVRMIGRQMNWKEIAFKERMINESVKEHYEKQNALATYTAFEGTPIVYGLHFRKK